MFLASLSAVHEPAQVTRGGFHDRPIIHIKLGALTLTCSVDDARELAANLLRAANEATRSLLRQCRPTASCAATPIWCRPSTPRWNAPVIGFVIGVFVGAAIGLIAGMAVMARRVMDRAMSTVADFRVYESAARFAARAGIPQRDAVHAVAVARKAGGSQRRGAVPARGDALHRARPTTVGAADDDRAHSTPRKGSCSAHAVSPWVGPAGRAMSGSRTAAAMSAAHTG